MCVQHHFVDSERTSLPCRSHTLHDSLLSACLAVSRRCLPEHYIHSIAGLIRRVRATRLRVHVLGTLLIQYSCNSSSLACIWVTSPRLPQLCTRHHARVEPARDATVHLCTCTCYRRSCSQCMRALPGRQEAFMTRSTVGKRAYHPPHRPYKREQTHLCTVLYPSTRVHHFTFCTACCVRYKVLACSGNHLNSKVGHIYNYPLNVNSISPALLKVFFARQHVV